MDEIVLAEIRERLVWWHKPKRRPWSVRWPMVRPVIIEGRRGIRKLKNRLEGGRVAKKREEKYPWVVARHQSVLVRQTKDGAMWLQEGKITNLKLAVEKLNGLVIRKGEVFSFWEAVGEPKREKGYVEGMLLSRGRVVEGVGGGLCQLSNFLFWIFLHCDVQIVERHHHSFDVFPDSGRVLPFGSGATILYNYIDLKIKNVSGWPLQLELWLTDKYLRGKVRVPRRLKEKYHVTERHHTFVKHEGRYFRYNQIWREKFVQGRKTGEEKIATNFAPVMYLVDEGSFTERGCDLVVA